MNSDELTILTVWLVFGLPACLFALVLLEEKIDE